MGKTIVINLNTNSISEMPTPAEHYGRGLAMKLVRQYAKDGCSRLDERKRACDSLRSFNRH